MLPTLARADQPTGNQYFVKYPVTWEQFKSLQASFVAIAGVRLVYCEGMLEIMGVGLQHEMISTLLGSLLSFYFLLNRVQFISTGAYSQVVEGQTEFQADLSYSFNGRKEVSDLCIEVVVTSGSVQKLRKYLLRGVPEVWFWEDGKIAVYSLQNDGYVQLESSLCLPDLDIKHLEQCLLMDSHLDAMVFFADRYK